VAGFSFHFEEKCLIDCDVWMLQTLDIYEILLEEEDVLSIEGNGLDCISLIGCFLIAISDDAMCSFSDFIADFIHVLED
jgi:hypothetical protein